MLALTPSLPSRLHGAARAAPTGRQQRWTSELLASLARRRQHGSTRARQHATPSTASWSSVLEYRKIKIIHTILCTLVLELFEPYGANKPFPTGAAWNAQPLAWMLCAADTAVTASIGELYEADWTAVASRMAQGGASAHWIRTCEAWAKLMEHIWVQPPQTYEQALSCSVKHRGASASIASLWEPGAGWVGGSRPEGVDGIMEAHLQSGPRCRRLHPKMGQRMRNS